VKSLLLIFLFNSAAYAKVLYPTQAEHKSNAKSEIIINSLYEDIFKRVKHLKITEPIAEKKSSINSGERGKLIIERMKQKNREKLARMRGQDPSNITSGKDIIQNQLKENKDLLKNINEQRKMQEDNYADIPLSLRRSKAWQEQARAELELVKERVLKEHKDWKKKYIKKLRKLALEQKEFVTRTDEYKKGITDIPLVLPVNKKELKKNIENTIEKEYFLIDGATSIDVRDQRVRPTCSAFAGVRLMEILLAQNSYDWDLSEQYFYWASKEDCQQRKCSSKGSWVGHGINFEKKQQTPSIPLEEDCPYNGLNSHENETQLPLSRSCKKGKVGIRDFNYHQTLDAVLKQINLGKAVIASLRLSPNFYKNQGLVLYSERFSGNEKDQHNGGHAVVFVGYMKIPKALNEGSLCFITANSWGEGWGIDGHACLSERWILEHRKKNPFVTIDALEIVN
jgi:C1A family cysteine protease